MVPLVHNPGDSTADSNKASTEDPITTTSDDVIADAFKEPPLHPRTELMKPSAIGLDYRHKPTFSMNPDLMPTKDQLEEFGLNDKPITYDSRVYPLIEEISEAFFQFFSGILEKSESFDPPEKVTIDADELVRFQQVLDEFGHADPQFPPSAMKTILEEGLTGHVLSRVLNWAIVINLAVDGDLRHTLLPRRIVKLLRDFDCESKSPHLLTGHQERSWTVLYRHS